MFSEIIEALKPYAGDIVIVTILAIVCYFGIKRGLLAYHRAKMQSASVIARARNKLTLHMWRDMMDIKIMGILPVGTRLEDALWDLMPRMMQELEEERTRNPLVWRENIKYLLPIALYIKALAKYKPQEMLGHVMGFFQAKEPDTGDSKPTESQEQAEDKGSDQAPAGGYV